MQDVFRAVTLSFLIASLYLALCGAADYVAIYALQVGDPRYGADASFRMALANASLLASLLCVWLLLVTAFAKRYVSRLRPGLTLTASASIALPLVLLKLLLELIDPDTLWPLSLSLVLSLLWTSVGLHLVLWYLTADGGPSPERS